MRVLLCLETHLLAEGIVKLLLQLRSDAHCEYVPPAGKSLEERLSSDFDLLVLDLNSVQPTAHDLLIELKSRNPSQKVIFACDKLDNKVLKAYRNGLDGCFSKNDSTDTVSAALSAVLDGKVHVPQSIIMNILYEGYVFTGFDLRLNQLSKREMTVLEKIADGHNMKEAARQLKLSASTLSTHKARIMKKLGITNGQEFRNFISAFVQAQKSPAKFGEAST